MLTTAADAIIFGLRASQAVLHRCLGPLKPEEYEYQPVPGANSPAWVLGHLTLTDRRLLGGFGVTDLPPLPDGFAERFAQTGHAAGVQKDLGDPKQLVGLFDAHRELLISAVRAATPDQLDQPLPKPGPLAKTLGEAALFMGPHVALHVGQITVAARGLGHAPSV